MPLGSSTPSGHSLDREAVAITPPWRVIWRCWWRSATPAASEWPDSDGFWQGAVTEALNDQDGKGVRLRNS
jgi:hypothetical protein